MTDSSTPETPQVPPLTAQQVNEAEQIARFLDPDLQAAVMQGNASVIQAIAAGAQTTDQVVTMMLRQGALPEMMPPGVRELMQQRLHEQALKREEEEGFQKKLAAGVVGLTMAGMVADPNAAIAAAARAEQTATQDRDMWRNRSSAELATMSLAEWNSLTTGQQQGLIDETVERVRDAKNQAGQSIQDVFNSIDEDSRRLGLSEQEAQERKSNIVMAVTHNPDGQPFDLSTPEGRAAARANIEKLPERDRKLAEQMLRAYEDVYRTQHADDTINPATAPGTNPADAHPAVTTTHEILRRRNEELRNAPTAQATNEAYVGSDKALDTAAQVSEHAQPAEVAQVRTARDENLSVRQEKDGAVAKAELQAPMQSDEYADSTPAAKAPVASAPRLSIDARPLEQAGLAQLGAPANDAVAPLQPEEKRRPVAPGAGMGASA